VVLGRVPATIQSSSGTQNSKNTADDVDIDLFSIYQFVKLACEGQTCALEMLWTPPKFYTELPSEPWFSLRQERDRFLSKNMKAFVGYARAQAAKYSLKGERLTKLREFYTIVQRAAGKSGDTPMVAVWDDLPRDDERENPQGIKELQIAGKWFGSTTRTGLVALSVRGVIERYGKRAAAAAEAGGSDWKALSHALRVSLQCEDLILRGSMTFPHEPLRRDYLLQIKLGQVPMEEVSDEIDESLARVESFAKASALPEKVDRNWWDDWLVDTIGAYVL